MGPTALLGAVLLTASLAGACSDDDPASDVADLEISKAAVKGEYGSHVASYERWYQGETRGDLADDSAVVDPALDAAREAIADEAADERNNGEVMGQPRAAFAVDTAYGSVVYAIGHIEYDIEYESYTASGVPLPFGVVVMLDDDGKVADVYTETPISQAESATAPPEGRFALAAYADPAGEQLLVLDTGHRPSVMVGIRRGDSETGPIAVETPRSRPDVATNGYALLDTDGTAPYTADVRATKSKWSGLVTGTEERGLFFDAFNACCTTKAITGGDAPLTKRDARALVKNAVGDRVSPTQYDVSFANSVFQARLPDGGVAVVRGIGSSQVVAARLADGAVVAARCVNPDEVKSFVCHVPTTDSWLVGTDRPGLETRTAGSPWRPGTSDYMPSSWTLMALLDGASPEMRIKVEGEWVTVDIGAAYGTR